MGVKHIVKQIIIIVKNNIRETYRFIFGARHRSGLIHQHIVKHVVNVDR